MNEKTMVLAAGAVCALELLAVTPKWSVQVKDGVPSDVAVTLDVQETETGPVVGGTVRNLTNRRLAVDLDGPAFAPWKVVRGASKFYYPYGDGWRVRRFPTVAETKAAGKDGRLGPFWTVREDGTVYYKTRYECEYPSRLMTMQFVVLSDGKTTRSYVVKDPACSAKHPVVEYDPEKSELSFRFIHRFTLEPGATWRLPRTEVLARKGDWQVAALDYGAWFAKAVKHAPVPDWVRDSPSFPLVICKQQNGKMIWPFTDFAALADALEAFGANQIQILGRGPGGHDNLYPDYTPDPAQGGREALEKGLKLLRARGIRTYAYVNGQLIEQEKTDYWKTGGGSTAGVMKPDGTRYGESWWKYKDHGQKAHSFDVGCPCDPTWKRRLHEIASDAVALGFDGLYVDQLGKQRPLYCCDGRHDHPAGTWVFGQDRVALMESMRAACVAKNPNFVLETEGYCEPMASTCVINLGLAYILDGVGRRFNESAWLDAWPELSFLTNPDYITSDRFASPIRTRHEVNAAAAVGYRLDLEIRYATDRQLFEKCEHVDYAEYKTVVDPPWDFSPPYSEEQFRQRDLKAERAYIKAVNLFRLKHRDVLLRGIFRDELDFRVVTDARHYTAKRWVSRDGRKSGVLVWNGDAVPRTFTVRANALFVGADEPEAGAVDEAKPIPSESLRLYSFDEPIPLPNLDGFEHPAGGRLGVGLEGRDRHTWEMKPALSALKALGVKKARIQTGWGRTETRKGVYDWHELDDEVNDLVALGVEPWMCLCYGNPLYKTPEEGDAALGIRMNPLSTPEGEAAWRRYVRACVARYKDRVKCFEVWNEPNVSVFLYVKDRSRWVDEYIRLVKITSEDIRAVAPDAKVIVNTASTYSGRPLFEKGIGTFCDVLSFHGYEEVPETYTRQLEESFYGQIRRTAPHVEIWCGEAGIPSAQPKGGTGALYWVKVDEDVQARWMARHLVRHLGDPQIAHVSYFHLYDFEHFSRQYRYHYGVLREDYSRKPSFGVLQRVKAFFDDGACRPDRTITLLPLQLDVPFASQSFVRNGQPLFAYVMPLPLAEDPATRYPLVDMFLADTSVRWRDPVVVDVVDGTVCRLPLSKDGVKLVLPLSAHLRFVTEAAALKPYLDLPARTTSAPRPVESSGQFDHEFGKGK